MTNKIGVMKKNQPAPNAKINKRNAMIIMVYSFNRYIKLVTLCHCFTGVRDPFSVSQLCNMNESIYAGRKRDKSSEFY